MGERVKVQNIDVTYRLVTSPTSDVTSQTLPTSHSRTVLGFSLAQLAFGIALTSTGAALNAYSKLHADQSTPPVWWVGLMPLFLGTFGVWNIVNNKPQRMFYWGICSLVCTVFVISLMVVCGNYNPGYYHVWPYNTSREGQPVCKPMVDTCYCQDYYHGKLSRIEEPHVQYIYEGVKWKDTSYPACADVAHVTWLFYITHTIFGLYAAMTILITTHAVSFRICQNRMSFMRLRDEEYHVAASFRPDSSDTEALPGE